jgi:hypothetical protein
VSGHRHESYDIYGLDGTSRDAREALALASGLREDLGVAEDRIRDLEGKLASLNAECDREMRKLWAHIANMPGGI